MGLIPYSGREALGAEDDRPAGRQSQVSIVRDAAASFREGMHSLATRDASNLDVGSTVAGGGNTATVLLLYAPRPAMAGEVAHVLLSLKNNDTKTDECALSASDLIGVSGHRIPVSHVRVSPNPASIPAAGSTDVQIEIRIPSAISAGRYTGLLQVDGGESLRALVQLTVGIDSRSSVSVLPAAQPYGEMPVSTPRATAVVSKAARPELRRPFPYTLELLAQVKASLAQGERIGPTPDGFRVNFPITGGRIVGKRFNATVEGGGAHALRIREDGTAIVAVKATLRTDDGARVFTEYSGVLDLGENGYQDALNGHFPPRPQLHLAPRFVCASPAYGWLNRLQCLGIGYVTMADLDVNYDLYAMRLTDAGAPG